MNKVLTAFLKVVGWCVIIFTSLFFLIFTILPLLDTNDSVVFEASTFGIALGRFAGLIVIGGIVPLLIARRYSKSEAL